MGAYICSICDNMFCSHEVNYYACDKCDRAFCEDCWADNLEEDQDEMGNLCGDCYRHAHEEAKSAAESRAENPE